MSVVEDLLNDDLGFLGRFWEKVTSFLVSGDGVVDEGLDWLHWASVVKEELGDLPLKALEIFSLAFFKVHVYSLSSVGASSAYFLFFVYFLLWAGHPTIYISCVISSTFFLMCRFSKSSCCMVRTRASRSSSVNSLSFELEGNESFDGGMRASQTGALTNGLIYKEASYWSCSFTSVRGSSRSCCSYLANGGIG